ncbi:MAG: hypothetical protein IH609_15870 [Dehalococcoidia bacterium]|nr:hypothetical protein [Dehalococcoidia bacterium]
MTLIASALADVTVGEVTSFRNLTLFPLMKGRHHHAGYHTLGEALILGGIRVTEVSDAGSVPELKVTNSLDRPVLLLDGEELVGAKQNRVFNLSILVPANSELLVPVSCVEAGRWQRSSPEFRRAGRAQYAAGRAERVSQVSDSLESAGLRRSAQSEVWQDIAAKGKRMGVDSETGAMADIYRQFEGTVDEFVKGLPVRDGQVGAVFAIGDRIVGLDLFDADATFRSLLETLVQSYALDALESPGSEATSTADSAAAFLKSVGSAPSTLFKAVGLGDDLRLRDDAVSGAALVVDGELVHLCAYPAGVGHR